LHYSTAAGHPSSTPTHLQPARVLLRLLKREAAGVDDAGERHAGVGGGDEVGARVEGAQQAQQAALLIRRHQVHLR